MVVGEANVFSKIVKILCLPEQAIMYKKEVARPTTLNVRLVAGACLLTVLHLYILSVIFNCLNLLINANTCIFKNKTLDDPNYIKETQDNNVVHGTFRMIILHAMSTTKLK